MSPLPHFLNLPLPPIPAAGSKPQPLLFKLNLSAEQYEELLSLDAEVEEGEEGGLRVDFDPNGKAALHLNPTRILQLNPPRSGPLRTNRPEEIYRHSTPSSSASSTLTGLFRIPTSTPVYDLQTLTQPPSDLAAPNSTHTRLLEPSSTTTTTTTTTTKANNNGSKPSHHHHPSNNNHHSTQPTRPSRPSSTADLNRSEKERIAGQRLKEKRLEDDRKKKEKQIAILPDAPAPTTANKRTRLTKPKPSNRQVSSSIEGRQPPSNNSSRNQPSPAPVPASQPPPPRRALPGSKAGKQLAHGLNQHLANPSATLSKSVSSQSQSEAVPPPQQPIPAPAPPPVTFKPSSLSKRNQPPILNHSLINDSKSAPSSEPPSATKFSTSTGLTSLSEEGETEQRLPDTYSQPAKPPTPPMATLKSKTSIQFSKSSPRPDVAAAPNGSTKNQPASSVPAHERPSSATPAPHKRPVKRQATGPTSISKTSSGSPPVENAPSPVDGGDYPDSSSKRPRPDSTAGLVRPRKTQRRDGHERRPLDDGGGGASIPSPQSNRPRSNSSSTRAEDQPRKLAAHKNAVHATVERNAAVAPISHHQAGVVVTSDNHSSKKRTLDVEAAAPAASQNPATKRVRQEEGGHLSSSGLPTIRKMVRAAPPMPAPAAVVDSETMSQNGAGGHHHHHHHHPHGGVKKTVKKKKKSKKPIDYTSSEVEEGEEPGEIVSTSSRSRQRASAASQQQQQTSSSSTLTRHRESLPDTRPPLPPPPRSTQPEEPTRDAHAATAPKSSLSSSAKPAARPSITSHHSKHGTAAGRLGSPIDPEARVAIPPQPQSQRPPEPPQQAQQQAQLTGASSSPSYKKLRLTFHQLLKHYELVCSRIEGYKLDRASIPNLPDVQDLLFEANGLEAELDRLRNWLSSHYL
ncbi:hypothetical protein PCANC_13846 [Puccinia coronata f. sp. avenae]|uniref:Uncharacterized protein n=1 Tax=Puccinia coronata f. sp. avenae TaxID=200324 RepID=A0A2N5UT31_9BASI|nr:hypothetical protein PCANC_13846 [Puccinia coronata f. sp. avenae]